MPISLPFTLRGRPGRVDVEHGPNEDPARWGYPLLGLDSLVERSRGCPVVQASVEYPGEGYAAVMGWIQVTAQRWPPTEREELLVDVAPQMQAVGARMPYFAFGAHPTFFDAPSTDDRDYQFRAAAFLTASPDALMTPVVEPLCGFGWGYRIVDETPHVDPLQPAGATEWTWMRATLERDYPAWTFGDLDPPA
jgi:hypothetical protein